MLSFVSDEDFNGRIIRGLFLRMSNFDLRRVQDVGLSGADDETVLQWAADHDRLLLTHDARTMPKHAIARLHNGLPVPGLFVVDDLASIGHSIEDILLIAECSDASEWQDKIYYLPFRP